MKYINLWTLKPKYCVLSITTLPVSHQDEEGGGGQIWKMPAYIDTLFLCLVLFNCVQSNCTVLTV